MVKHKIPKEIEESINELQKNKKTTSNKKPIIPEWAIDGKQGLYTTAPPTGRLYSKTL